MFFEEYSGQKIEQNEKNPEKKENILEQNENIPEQNENTPEQNKDTPEQNLLEAVNSVKAETYEYWSFFRNYPNNFHENLDRSFKGAFNETAEDLAGIPEKKINGFDMSFDDGKSVKVIEENGTINFSFSDGGNEAATITLSNIKNIGSYLKNLENTNGNNHQEGNKEVAAVENDSDSGVNKNVFTVPEITISGNMSQLPKFLSNTLNSFQGGKLELSGTNMQKFMEVFNILNDEIIGKKMHEFDGYVDSVQRKMDEKVDKMKHANNWIDEAMKNFSMPDDLDVFIDSLLMDERGEYEDANKVLLCLGIYLRSSSKQELFRQINQKLGYDTEEGVDKKGEMFGSEDAVEFLAFSGEEFRSFIMNADVLVDLAKEEAQKQRDEKISDIEREMKEYQSNSTITMRDDGLNRNSQLMTKIDPILSEKQREKEKIQEKTNLILNYLNK